MLFEKIARNNEGNVNNEKPKIAINLSAFWANQNQII